jgi:hypothetical protein
MGIPHIFITGMAYTKVNMIKLGTFVLVTFFLLFSTSVHAWTNPSQQPPNGNVSQPLNTGTSDQVKNAGLSLNTLWVPGASQLTGLVTMNGGLTITSGNLILPTAGYINFSGSGSTGYGLRYSGGNVQYRNSGGSWTNIAPTLTYAQYGYTNQAGTGSSLCNETTFAPSMTSCEIMPSTAGAAVTSAGWTYTASSTRIYKVIPGQSSTPWTFCVMNGYQTPYDWHTDVQVIRMTDNKWYISTFIYSSVNTLLSSVACYR